MEAFAHGRGERIEVHDEDAPTGIVRRLKGEQVREVETAVSTWRLELRTGKMVGHDEPLSPDRGPLPTRPNNHERPFRRERREKGLFLLSSLQSMGGPAFPQARQLLVNANPSRW